MFFLPLENKDFITALTTENEYDLHTKVIGYIKKFYPNPLLIVGQPDIMTNLHKHHNRFCIEFKMPKNNGQFSEPPKDLLQKYKMNNYKYLVSSRYDEIIHQITNYMLEIITL